jgi:ligand-binding sensor domain-containing protein
LGLWHYQPDTKQWKTYRYADDDNHTLSSDEVHCTLVAEDGSLWVGTSGGLCNYDSKEDRFERIHLDIPNQHITGIIEDHGALWLSTERGIIRYEPSQNTSHETYENVLRFSYHDGLVSEHFQPNAALRTSDGLDLTTLSDHHRQYCLKEARQFLADGLLTMNGQRLALTRKGLFVSDMVMSALMLV